VKTLPLHVVTQGDEGRPAIVFLHGFLGSSRDWQSLTGQFAPDYFTLCPDLPGHGQSVGLRYPEDYTMEGAAGQVRQILDAHGIGSCLLVGYSMGGRLALHLAAHHAARFHGALVESARPGLAAPEEQDQRVSQDEIRAAEIESGDFAAFLDRWYRQPLFETLAQQPGRIEALIKSRSGNAPSELARSLRAMGAGRQASLWPELPALTVPILAVAGADDRKFAPIAQQMAGLSPSVEAAIVADAGHNVHLEQPEDFARVLEGFARRVLT